MADIELMNLVTTKLVQEKKELEYQLRSLLEPTLPSYGEPHQIDLITDTLDRYSGVINRIQLWETLLNEIITPEQNENEGENNNEN